jgi:hypothetical protein
MTEQGKQDRPSEDNAAHASSRTVSWAMLLHVVCCGLPLLLFVLISAGLTVDVLWRVAPYLALIGLLVAAFWLVYSLRRRCWTCTMCDEYARGQAHGVQEHHRLP